jgi:hypothetical protein
MLNNRPPPARSINSNSRWKAAVCMSETQFDTLLRSCHRTLRSAASVVAQSGYPYVFKHGRQSVGVMTNTNVGRMRATGGQVSHAEFDLAAMQRRRARRLKEYTFRPSLLKCSNTVVPNAFSYLRLSPLSPAHISAAYSHAGNCSANGRSQTLRT